MSLALIMLALLDLGAENRCALILHNPTITPQEQTQLGCNLVKDGWNIAKQCNDGHTWAYLLEKEAQTKICKGINARGGPAENPCVDYKKSKDAFQEKAITNCWENN